MILDNGYGVFGDAGNKFASITAMEINVRFERLRSQMLMCGLYEINWEGDRKRKRNRKSFDAFYSYTLHSNNNISSMGY